MSLNCLQEQFINLSRAGWTQLGGVHLGSLGVAVLVVAGDGVTGQVVQGTPWGGWGWGPSFHMASLCRLPQQGAHRHSDLWRGACYLQVRGPETWRRLSFL